MNDIRIQKSRIRLLNEKPVQKGHYVLYWMQQSQRAETNHALEYAVEIANHYDLPVKTVFILTPNYPEANLRHYVFMLEGLSETREMLAQRGIAMEVHIGSPESRVISAGNRASVIVCDRGYLRHQNAWRSALARQSPCRVIEVESDAVVPVGVASEKTEYGAYTLRPKIHKVLEQYLVDVVRIPVRRRMPDQQPGGIDLSRWREMLGTLPIDKQVSPVSGWFYGGTSRAKSRFDEFLKNRINAYPQNSNQPQTDDVSFMGPYLHFGQISPLYLALEIQKARGIDPEAKKSYLEQLIVRRELSINFVTYASGYDTLDAVPGWARDTLTRHLPDKRPYRYPREQLENAATHDPYWNAAMKEMKFTGYMHNYMRMYWAKKILEWSDSPQAAHQTTLALNNRYFLDGRDPNSYAGVAWNYGLHDRPWKERPIFGKVRYMAASGLERKCDIRSYVDKVDRMLASENG